MPETYTIENFDPSVIPSGFNAEARKTMRLAITLGWKLVVTNRGHCTMVAPPPNEHITINASQRKSDGPVKGIRAKLHTYANPLLAVAEDGSNVISAAQRTLANEERAAARRAQEQREVWEAQQKAEAEAAAADSVRTEDEPLDPEPATTYDAPTDADRAARTIVRTGPMVARRGRRRGYESEVANEREWSDGTVEYICALPGCNHGPDGGPYITENRLGIGPHRKVHINAGETTKAGSPDAAVTIDIPDYEPEFTRTYTPRDDRLRSLSIALLAKLVALGPDLTDNEKADALAQVALEWSHERTGQSLGTGREPLTDDQVLARIRSLVDNGMYQRQADEAAALRLDKAAAEERATKALADAEAAKAETLKVRSDLSGMLDMLSEYREGAKS